ncbi:BORCS4 [Mytilus edulis]|uniref:KxDL domain-containing protein n=2 Tax=Mytilus TaxID=6548 RepID=A0A8B6BLC6_MYTGA|nr:BORCS4 [Mytilus edulis]VDH92041.1 Hypothetical predicted protein [Mytilus galloprovincialis]
MEEEEESDNSSTKFAQSIVEQVNRSDIEAMVQVQRDMLSRYEKTNEMLINFNLLSLSRFEATSQEFKKHTQVLYEMKKDLDSVFRRIRQLKQRLGSMYPEAFSVCSDVYNMLSEDEEDGENKSAKKDKKKHDNKHSSDHDSPVTADGMNSMLENHGKKRIEQNGSINCDKTDSGPKTGIIHNISINTDQIEQLHICNSEINSTNIEVNSGSNEKSSIQKQTEENG